MPLLFTLPNMPAIVSHQPLRQSIAIKAPDLEAMDDAALFEYATRLLKAGRRYEIVIKALKIAVHRAPQNPDYQLALGCAYVSRFVSLSVALKDSEGYPERQTRYQRWQVVWEKAQSDPNHIDYGTPPLTPPVAPTTSDDNKPFTMTPKEAHEQMRVLGKAALTRFESAQTLVQGADSKEKSTIEYVRGWGLFLLWRMGKEVMEETGSQKNSTQKDNLSVSEDDFVRCFRACVATDPQNSDNWHSLALSLAPDLMDTTRNNTYSKFRDGIAVYNIERMTEIKGAFQHALSLKKNDFNLLYQLALVNLDTDRPEAIRLLEAAVKKNNSHTLVWYLLADQRLRQWRDNQGSKVQDGGGRDAELAAITLGNSAPSYAPVAVYVPAPLYLRKACDLSPMYGSGQSLLVVLRTFNKLGSIAVQRLKEDETSAISLVNVMIDMGVRAVQAVNGEDFSTLNRIDREMIVLGEDMALAYSWTMYEYLQKAQKEKPSRVKEQFLSTHADLPTKIRTTERILQRPL